MAITGGLHLILETGEPLYEMTTKKTIVEVFPLNYLLDKMKKDPACS